MKAVFALAMIASLSSGGSAAGRAVRILPFGDSITQWQCNNESSGGYRGFLGDALHSDGFVTDFVGSMYDCGNHEGHSGWTVAALSGIAEEVLTAHQPDIVLFEAGTNDLFFNQPGYNQGANVTGTLARIDTVLNITFSLLPKVIVLVSGITYINATRCANYSQAPWHPPNCPDDMQPWIVELNQLLPSLIARYNASNFNAAFHDPNLGADWEAADYWTWGIHFSQSGFQKLGNAWHSAVKPVLQSMQTPTVPRKEDRGYFA